MKYVDVHCHLDDSRFEEDLDKIVARARKFGVKFIITSGVNPLTNRRALKIASKYSDIVRVSFGIYPIDAIMNKIEDSEKERMLRHVETFSVDDELKWIEENKNKCVAIGECGLDYKVIEGYNEEQKMVFEKVIELAKKIDKPLIIHSRKAELDAIDIMEEVLCGHDSGEPLKIKNVVMHCFNGKKSLIHRCIENGWSFSVPPVITRLEHFKMLVEMVPVEQLLTETDAPYLSPVAGERNEPRSVSVTVKEIAKIKGLDENDVAEQMFINAVRLFNL